MLAHASCRGRPLRQSTEVKRKKRRDAPLEMGDPLGGLGAPSPTRWETELSKEGEDNKARRGCEADRFAEVSGHERTGREEGIDGDSLRSAPERWLEMARREGQVCCAGRVYD